MGTKIGIREWREFFQREWRVFFAELTVVIVTQRIPTSSDERSGKLEIINGNVGKPPTFPINLIIIIKLIYIKPIN